MKLLVLLPLIASVAMPTFAARDEPKPGMWDNVYCFSYNWNPNKYPTSSPRQGGIEPDAIYTQEVCDYLREHGHDVKTKEVQLSNSQKQKFLAVSQNIHAILVIIIFWAIDLPPLDPSFSLQRSLLFST